MNERRLKMNRVAKDSEIVSTSMLQNIERLNKLKSIQQTDQSITFTSMDYRNYEHKEGDVVYCDPPYKGTRKYNGTTFDHDAFYEWVRTRDYKVYFSEYSAPDDFVSVFNTNVQQLMSGGNSSHNKATEHLFIHKKFFEKLSI